MIKAIETHRALQFDQSQWLKPYIESNTQKRKEAKKKMTKVEKFCTH